MKQFSDGFSGDTKKIKEPRKNSRLSQDASSSYEGSCVIKSYESSVSHSETSRTSAENNSPPKLHSSVGTLPSFKAPKVDIKKMKDRTTYSPEKKGKMLKPTKSKSPKNDSNSKKSGKSASKSSSQDNDRYSLDRPSIDRPSMDSYCSEDDNSYIELLSPTKLVNSPTPSVVTTPIISPRNMHSEVLINSFEKAKKKTTNKQSQESIDNIVHHLAVLGQEPMLMNAIIDQLLNSLSLYPNFSSNFNVIEKGSETSNDMTAILLKKWQLRLQNLEQSQDNLSQDSTNG